MIELKQIVKTYEHNLNVLNNISLKIEIGEYLEIIGKSGSGKSTFLNIIGLLDTNFSGELIYNSCNIKKMNDMQISRIRNEMIGFVFQSYNLLSELTVYENIILPLIYSKYKLTYKLKQQIKTLVNELQINELMEKRIKFLSGGEKQRVAIARALCLSPPIILADEPTGNLDPLNSEIVYDTFRKLSHNGKTIILVTHDQKLDVGAHRILTLQEGKFI